MRTGRIFWGVLFMVVGLLFLLERVGWLVADWETVLKFWPLVLVLWGIAMLVRSDRTRWLGPAIGGVFVGVVVLAMINVSWVGAPWIPRGEYHEQRFQVPGDAAVDSAVLRFESGAGTFVFGDTTSALFAARTRSGQASYWMTSDRQGGTQTIRLGRERKTVGSWFGRMQNRADVSLSPDPVWDVDVNAGAADIELDMEAYRLARLKVNTGAATVRVKLGAREPEQTVSLHAGASSIRIRVPDSAGCRVTLSASLSSKSLKGFTQEGSGRYQTENFDRSARKILIDISAGVSSIHVSRY